MKKIFTQAFLMLSVLLSTPYNAQNFPSGFSQVKIFSMEQATAMAFAPDGRLFICQRNGTVRVFKNGSLLNTPFVTLTVDQNGERGISGITFDPNFNTNHYVYIYYSAVTPSIHNRLSRFTANGDVAVPNSEFVLLDAEPVTSHFHNGGGLGFGPDGKLYLSMGEDNKPNNSQNLATYKGKLLRINKDGTAPADNPYSSSSSQITKKIWCTGLRNPYTLAFQPGTGKLYINNVGADDFEEIHDGTQSQRNFGWPEVEGYSSNSSYHNPVFAYPHEATGQRGCAVTGGTFFNPQATNYPPSYTGKYFYMDYCNGWIYHFTPGNSSSNSVFATGLTTKNLALQVGPDGNLYYLNRDAVKGGLYKIIYSNNNAPAITSHPQNASVPEGQSVTFNVSASGAIPLTYQWKKNGVNIQGANSSSYTINNVQPSNAGSYNVIVSNSYGSAASNQAVLTVTEFNASPQASILTPTGQPMFRAGDVVYFEGKATDTEDGELPASAFEWEIQFHHNNNHFHPGQAIPAGVKSGTFATSSDDHTTANVFYRILLKVKDSKNLIDTTHIDIYPITSSVTINTQPAGLKINFGSQPFQTPFQMLSVEGLKIPMAPVSPQSKDGKQYIFSHWQHGGAPNQTIVVGPADSSYMAVYTETILPDANLITSGSSWKYLDNGSNQGTSWRNPAFDDSGWKTGNAQLGYGDGDEATVIGYGGTSSNKSITTYLRKEFFVSNPATIGNLELSLMRDDGAVVYINGQEVLRDNMPVGEILYNTRAVKYTDGADESKYFLTQIPADALVEGKNIIAVEIHQNSSSSSDVSFDLKLKTNITEEEVPGEFIPAGSAWKYLDNGSDQGSAWRTLNFDASGWKSGNGQLGYGDGDETTVVGYGGNASAKFITTYFRKEFNVSNPSAVKGLKLSLMRDDGAVVYLNGNEIFRNNMPAEVTYASRAVTYIDGAAESEYITADIPATGLLSGKNVVAVEIHQNSAGSSDISFDLKLEASGTSTVTPPPPPPAVCDASIQPKSATTFCQGGSVILQATQGQGISYQWRKNGVNISGATNSTYEANSSGDYQVKISFEGCEDFSAPQRVTVNTSITAKITTGGPTTFCSGENVLLYANTCSGYTYQWKRNGSDIPGATASSYLASTSGTYQVKIIQGSSVAWSAKVPVTAQACSGTAGRSATQSEALTSAVSDTAAMLKSDMHINVYPNPSTGAFAFELCLEDVPEDMMGIKVVNLMGQEVYTKAPKKISGCIKETIELSGLLPTGIYVLKLSIGEKTESTRVLLTAGK